MPAAWPRSWRQQRGLQLVFLNGCSTQGQVQGPARRRGAAVIATDQAIDDAIATDFATRFYQGLAGGAAIGTAFERGGGRDARCRAGAAIRHLGAAEEAADRRPPLPWRLHPARRRGALDWNLPEAADDPLFGLPHLPPLDLPDKPYRYLDWYRREDAEVFFGRGQRDPRLYHRVTAADGAPIVLFYGQSGVGKSSLLAAGLLPRLEQPRGPLLRAATRRWGWSARWPTRWPTAAGS